LAPSPTPTPSRRLAQGTASDHLAALHAYRGYFGAPTGLHDARRTFAADHFLNERALTETRQLKRQMLTLPTLPLTLNLTLTPNPNPNQAAQAADANPTHPNPNPNPDP